MHLLHPSSLGVLMTKAKSIDPALITPDLAEIVAKKKRTEEEKQIIENLYDLTVSETAKSYCKRIAKGISYDFETELEVKYLKKGLACEDDSIELLNKVYFKSYAKHSGRIETDLLSGECDILAHDMVRDIKTSWSLETFPVLIEDAHDDLYEWQGRAYMHLYDRPEFRLDFCMVTTPEELRRYESPAIHEVDHIPYELRVTTVVYPRCMIKEEKMLKKCRAAQQLIEFYKKQILIDHNYNY